MDNELNQQVRTLKIHIEAYRERGIEVVDFHEEFEELRKIIQNDFRQKLERIYHLHYKIAEGELKKMENQLSLDDLDNYIITVKRHLSIYKRILNELEPWYDRIFEEMMWENETTPEESESYPSTQIEKCIECGERAKFKCANCKRSKFCSEECAAKK